MESLEAYLARKRQELELLNGFLGSPLPLRPPGSAREVIEQKFHIAAALKAEHTLQDWALTETAWAHPGQVRVGPFEFSYDYQRADLDVRGPSFYELGESGTANESIYTASGMAAIAALLLGSARVFSEADIVALPDSYGETLELIESHARHLRLVQLARTPDELAPSSRPQILLFNSCVQAAAYETALAWIRPRLDLIVFDTTCFAGNSGRIRRVLRWASRWNIPAVLVRSHTKLDSLGVEYGRLGSAVFIENGRQLGAAQVNLLRHLANETRNAVRLFGGAALPAHFPPYVGTTTYWALTDKRIAAMLRNSRRTARYFASVLPGDAAELHFAHGLYVTLASERLVDEQRAKQVAAELAQDLSKAGLPLRHAGSFGFDFGAIEWFHHNTSARYAVRIAVADLPTSLWDEVSEAVAQWWSGHQRQRIPASRTNA